MIQKSTPQALRITVIALNYAPEPSGTAPYTSKLVDALAGSGHKVHVLAGYPHYPQWKIEPGYNGWSHHETLDGVQVSRFRHFVPRAVNNYGRAHLELSFGMRVLFARWHRPDVVLIVSPPLLSTALATLRVRFGRAKPPTGVWVQDIYSRGLEETGTASSRITKVMKRIEGYVLRSAKGIAVIHDRFGEYIVSELDVPATKLTTIRNWSHISSSPSVDRATSRVRLGWEPHDIIVLHAGNMGVKQGLSNVVETARLVDSLDSRVKFVLLGDGNQRESIEKMSQGVKSISFISSLPDNEYLSALESADILLVNELPGLREMSVPSKLTSYFTTGLPIIAATESNSTTASEIALSRGGIRVDPSSPDALLQGVNRIAMDSEFSQKLGESGRRYAAESLSQNTAILRYDAWLRELGTNKSESPRADVHPTI